MPPQRTQPAARAVKTERTHEENQERAYIAASRRSDRSIEARVESARRASEIHKKRTGRALKVTEQDVINEDMYEEEDEDMPRHMRAFTAHLQTGSADFNTRLANFVIAHFGGIEAAAEGLKKADVERAELERQGVPTDHLNMAHFLPAHLLQGNMMGLQHQMARQQQQLFGHPMPQQFMQQQNMAPNMMHMNAQPQMSYPHSPYGMQTQQQHQQQQIQQQMQQQFNQQQQFNNNNNMNNQMQQQHVQPLQMTTNNLQVPARVRSGSARSIHSNSPLPPATSPGGMLTPAQIHERNSRSASVKAVTPIPSIEDESTQNSMVMTNGAPRGSISNSTSSGNRSNEYLAHENSVDALLAMPDYQYGVNADVFATATPGTQQGGNGYFQPHHFATQYDPMAEMFKIGSAATPFENDTQTYSGNTISYTVKQEQTGQSGLTGQQLTIQPKQIGNSNQVVNQYLQGMEDSKGGVLGDAEEDNWDDWTAGGDYNQEQEA